MPLCFAEADQALQEGLEILPEAESLCSARGNCKAMNPKRPSLYHYPAADPAAEAATGPPLPPSLLAVEAPPAAAAPVAATSIARSAAAVSLRHGATTSTVSGPGADLTGPGPPSGGAICCAESL
jgi:hypothetical protein